MLKVKTVNKQNKISTKIGINLFRKSNSVAEKWKVDWGFNNTGTEKSRKPVNWSYLVSGEQKILEIWKPPTGHH